MVRAPRRGAGRGDALSGVTLTPLLDEDDALWACLTPEVSRLGVTPYGESRDIFDALLGDARLGVAEGRGQTYVVRLDLEPVGMTRLWEMDLTNRSAEIGYTWYRRDLWGSGVNSVAKLWLLTRAFEELDLIRVFFRVDLRNERSLRAVTRLGALREGLLRDERILADGHIHSRVVFSILAREWPDIRERLLSRIERYSTGTYQPGS